MLQKSSRKEIGNIGENIASQFLVKKGYSILERNYSRKWGEIDIVALKGEIIHFVEVKSVSRGSGEFSREMDYRPEELVHKSKLRKLARTASLYMEEHKDGREYQIDAVGIVMDPVTRTARCRLFEQVIDDE